MKQLFLWMIPLLFIFSSAAWAQTSDTRNFRLVKPPTESPVDQKRKAVVIGMSDYGGAMSLDNTLNDANDMAAALTRLGFEVTLLKDNDFRNLRINLTNWYNTIEGNDMAVFYFAGHGMEIEGENYLIPVGFEPNSSQADAQDYTLKVSNVLRNMELKQVGLKLIILDACRDNPFTRSWTRGRAEKGLASMDAPEGTYIAFAAAPGSTAQDGKNFNLHNGVFTYYLKGEIVKAGLSIDEIFNNVTGEVSNLTNKQQRPYRNINLGQTFYFIPPMPAVDILRLMQQADSCFQKSDYEEAKRLYSLIQLGSTKDVSAQIQRADDCLQALNLANGYLNEKKYTEARDSYRSLLALNANDSYAKKQYDWCEVQLTPVATTLVVTPKQLSFLAQGGTEPVSVATNAGAYDVVALPRWCSVTGKQPDGFSIACNATNGSSPREGTFEVKAKDKSEKIAIAQSGKPVMIKEKKPKPEPVKHSSVPKPEPVKHDTVPKPPASPHESHFLLMPGIAVGNTIAYSLTAGYLPGKFGGYAKVKSNFASKGNAPTGGPDDAFFADNYSKTGRFAVMAGVVGQLSKPLLFYAGVGYGSQWVQWKTLSGDLMTISTLSFSGFEPEAGLMLKTGNFVIGAGVSALMGKQTSAEANLSIGLIF